MSGTPALSCKSRDATKAIARPVALVGIGVFLLDGFMDHWRGILLTAVIALVSVAALIVGLAIGYVYVRYGYLQRRRERFAMTRATSQLPPQQPVYLVVPPSQRQLPGRDRYDPEYRVWSPEEYRRSRR